MNQKIKEKIKAMPTKNKVYLFFILTISIAYLFHSNFFNTAKYLKKEATKINAINTQLDSLSPNGNTQVKDSLAILEEKILYEKINEKLITYLFRAKNYEDLSVLKKYFAYAPEVLNEIPSVVPLEKGNYKLSSIYGKRYHPIHKKNKKHYGVDLAAKRDNKVYSTADGIVIAVKVDREGYGKHIIIKHRYGFKSMYAHLNKILVRKNQRIKQYTLIGTVGSTGTSTGNHLHYEVIKNNKKIDPFKSFNLKKDVLTNNPLNSKNEMAKKDTN